MYAPIVVFAYNRPDHLNKTLSALALNPEAIKSKLFIYIDGPKDEKGKLINSEVETVAKKYLNGFFKETVIINSPKNKGLAQSVISGVTEVLNEFGKVIVTEDDSIADINYLSFMNDALNYYENDKRIWSVGGYTVPINIPQSYTYDFLVTQRSSSYAWGIWKDRWDKVDWEVSDYKKFHWDFKERKQFNRWGDDRASMLDDQMLGRINSWAIRFDYAMFRNGMFNIIPRYSLIKNIGHDGSGTHSKTDLSENDPFAVKLHTDNYSFILGDVDVNEQIRKEFNKYFRVAKRNQIKRFLGNVFRSLKTNA